MNKKSLKSAAKRLISHQTTRYSQTSTTGSRVGQRDRSDFKSTLLLIPWDLTSSLLPSSVIIWDYVVTKARRYCKLWTLAATEDDPGRCCSRGSFLSCGWHFHTNSRRRFFPVGIFFTSLSHESDWFAWRLMKDSHNHLNISFVEALQESDKKLP